MFLIWAKVYTCLQHTAQSSLRLCDFIWNSMLSTSCFFKYNKKNCHMRFNVVAVLHVFTPKYDSRVTTRLVGSSEQLVLVVLNTM